MKIAQIINPSDTYTICADDWKAACLATLFLGSGNYALRSQDGEQHMPIFLFDGAADAWWKEQFGESLESYSKGANAAMVAALDSIVIGNRWEFMGRLAETPEEEKQAFIDDWNDKNRTSLNDIGDKARHIANALRKTLNTEAAK